ncbi:hypothetical protein tb265_43940 [Gemmatimonadetes bacterium T265]|nr:hypothetical protein tb265_43940 [Gemmatimonadetes bacterium T265]
MPNDEAAHSSALAVPSARSVASGYTPPPSAFGPLSRRAATSVTRRTSPDVFWPDSESAEPPVVDVGQLAAMVGFPWRALRRRRRLAWGVFGAVCGAAVLTALVAPRQYDVETSILAQRNFVMPALGNPRRSVPAESDAPTRMATEAVLNHANLVALVRETGLEQAWPRLRSPAGKAKDAVKSLLGVHTSADEWREQIVGSLQRQLWVVTDEGTVRIGVHFPDPQLALRLVQTAQRNFLDARHASEQSLIGESIGILETHVAEAHAQIDTALAEVKQFTPAGVRAPVVRATPSAWGGARRRVRSDPAATSLARDLAAERAAIASAESDRAQRASALRARLSELRLTRGAAHPDVVNTQQALAALATEPPELAAHRTAERQLATQVAAAGGSPSDVAQSPGRAEASLATAALARLAAPVDTLEDPRLTYARSRLKIAVADYEDLLDRLESARIELETARAAFKYRYTVITPAQLPSHLARPNISLVLGGGLVVAAVLAAFAAVVVDLAGGRLVEGWQVSRLVGLPVLGEAPRP